MSADTVVKALLAQWISRFGVPARITSDRGRQFESSIFAELLSTIGATHLRTTPYHPQSNGIIERWHRTFKAAILCHNPARWVHHLPTILLGLRVAFKPDLKASPAELVYGSTLSIPGEFFQEIKISSSTSDFISDFRALMQKIKPTDTAHHSTPRTFVSKNLQSSTHVFVRNDSIRPTLTHPYDGPYPVLKRFDKFFTILIRGRQSNINIDRLKPAFTETSDLSDGSLVPEAPIVSSDSNAQQQFLPDSIVNQKVPSNNDLNASPAVSFSPELTQPKATSSGRQITVPLRFR